MLKGPTAALIILGSNHKLSSSQSSTYRLSLPCRLMDQSAIGRTLKSKLPVNFPGTFYLLFKSEENNSIKLLSEHNELGKDLDPRWENRIEKAGGTNSDGSRLIRCHS